MWSWWKRRHLRDLPDEVSDDFQYRSGFAAGEFLGAVIRSDADGGRLLRQPRSGLRARRT